MPGWLYRAGDDELMRNSFAAAVAVCLVVFCCGCQRFQPISDNVDMRFDNKTNNNCWVGGPGQRYWTHHDQMLEITRTYTLVKTVDPPHIPTCASLKDGPTVMADSIYVDIKEN